MSERIVIGRDEYELASHPVKSVLGRAALVSGLSLLTILQPDSLQDEPARHAEPAAESLFDSTVEWPFGTDHQELVFTSMGSAVATLKSDRLTQVTPADVSFDKIHCHRRQVYGDITVWTKPSIQYHFSDVSLPANSFLQDCLWDNKIDNSKATHLTIGDNAYPYVVHR